MGKGQGSIEYLFMVAVGLIIIALVVHYIYISSKSTPITGVAYIDPALSPEKPKQKPNQSITWIVYRYPPNCKAKKNCDFYVSVNLHYYLNSGKYRVWVYANGDSNDIRRIEVRLCNGATGVWNFPEDKGKRKIHGVYLHESDFPCALYIMAWRR
jgi:hypothetical protein